MNRPSQQFTGRQLGWMRRWHSQSHLKTLLGPRPTTADDWSAFLSAIEGSIAKDQYIFSGLHWHSIGGKFALSTDLLEDCLVIRKINDNIRRCYGLSQPNRASLIRTAKQALRETTPKTIIRIDLKGCFESISRGRVFKQLRTDARVSTETMALLDTLFRQAAKRFPGRMPDGIPRGLTVSASLAELILREVDAKLRMLPGLYLMLRYVDDILIFTTADESTAWSSVTGVIRGLGLRLNYAKSGKWRVACLCERTCVHGTKCPCGGKGKCRCATNKLGQKEIEYLGYKLIVGAHNASSKNKVFSILSDRKSAKIKTRIAKAEVDLRTTGDWCLFSDRISYLVSNQRVAVEPGKRGLFNGLSYTHSEYEEPEAASGVGTLKDLDGFYQVALRRVVSTMASKPANYAKLKSMSFISGFHDRRRTKFSAARVKRIKDCWVD